ncbi:MAG: helix-turn-helix domain-containing protein [Candidatus Omnitrophica bacterium]|nr:helix-turn-helix domain-containing protein [Candidatus Omnitrophota bacterium]
MPNDVMTVSEVADYLRLNPQTVYRKAKAGELPAVRIGRAVRFRRCELETWLKGLHSEMQQSRELTGITR